MYDLIFILFSDLRDSAWNTQPLSRCCRFHEADTWSILVRVSCEILQERNKVTHCSLCTLRVLRLIQREYACLSIFTLGFAC